MEINFFWRGMAIGLAIAAPVGPIGILCMRRTLSNGRLSGLVSGLGAASADAVYCSIAGFGLSFISGGLIAGQIWLRLIGGAFLCYFGYDICRKSSSQTAPTDQTTSDSSDVADISATSNIKTGTNAEHIEVNSIAPELVTNSSEHNSNHIFADYLSTFGLTLTNPITILAFGAIFAGLGVQDRAHALLSVTGVFIGSASWWLVLSIVVSLFRHKLNQYGMAIINRVAGVSIALFGILSLVSIFQASNSV